MRDLGLGGLARSRGRVVTKPQGVVLLASLACARTPLYFLGLARSQGARGRVGRCWVSSGFIPVHRVFIGFCRRVLSGFVGFYRAFLVGFSGLWWGVLVGFSALVLVDVDRPARGEGGVENELPLDLTTRGHSLVCYVG